MDVNEEVKRIKQSFRLMMDGATAQSMRDKGLDYHLNWGATLPRLREMADELRAEYGSSREQSAANEAQPSTVEGELSSLYYLSIALWKENVRECKILATMLMPADEMPAEVVDIWMEQTPNHEIAEQAAFNLYQHLPFAADKAYQWMASEGELVQLCGYSVLSRLFMRGQMPNERGINEFVDQAVVALQDDSLLVRKAALQAVVRFSQLGLVYERIARSALRVTPVLRPLLSFIGNEA